MKKLIFKMFLIFMPIWAKFFRIVARTGKGTEICLKNGFLPLPVHFYSPVPDLTDLDKQDVWNKKSALSGIDFRPEEQIQLLKELGKKYGHECDWSPTPTLNKLDFYTENNSFSFGCAAALHSIIRNNRPKRIIEVGSGNSSKVISAALILNAKEGDTTEYFVIDPYADDFTKTIPLVSQFITEKVQNVGSQHFNELQQNDILFIDSGHTVRTGSDVNFLFLDILPCLNPGVIVHFHDINLPYEYPKSYFVNPAFRVFWTEAYLLQAFLCFNSHFKIMLAMSYLTADHWDEFCKAFPHFDPKVHKATSGSFWIRRVS